MLRTQRGFTLVEMMVVAAIMGVLAMIATESYSKMARRSKKAYAKTTLTKAYAAEMNFLLEHHTFTQCLLQAGGLPTEKIRPYLVGFLNGNSALTCGPLGNQSCFLYAYSPTPLSCACGAPGPQGYNDCTSESTIKAAGPLLGSYTWDTPNGSSFKIGAGGDIGGKQIDIWVIDHTKKLTNLQAGE